MSNLEALMVAPDTISVSGKPCKVGRIINDLPEPYRSALDGYIATRSENGGLTIVDVRKRMLAAGLHASPSSLLRHRNHECDCPQKGTN